MRKIPLIWYVFLRSFFGLERKFLSVNTKRPGRLPHRPGPLPKELIATGEVAKL